MELATERPAPERPGLETDVCIVGAGPAGAMLGLLCARAGLDVTLVERNLRFEREFRGEGITPGGVKCLTDHGLMQVLPPDSYVCIDGMRLFEDGKRIFEVSFGELRSDYRLAIDIPQPELIGAIVREASKLPNFRLLMGTHPVALQRDDRGRVRGLSLKDAEGRRSLSSKIVVGCDGRYSSMRKLGGFRAKKTQMKRDVIWFKLPRPNDWPDTYTCVRIIRGSHLIVLPCHPSLLRVGMYMPKGGFSEFKRRGLEQLHREIARLEPSLADVVARHVTSWDDVSLLDIFTVEVEDWSTDGMILIGDAAHTCSPILGQGVNLALRDAVELAPVLSRALAAEGSAVVTRAQLRAFEKKRKRDIHFIRGFQNRNELLLSLSSAVAAWLRRCMYRLLNLLPTKPWLMTKIAMGVRQLD